MRTWPPRSTSPSACRSACSRCFRWCWSSRGWRSPCGWPGRDSAGGPRCSRRRSSRCLPDFLLSWSVEARTHYQMSVVLGTLALLLALRIAASPRRAGVAGFGVLGGVLGLAFWTNFLSLVFLAVGGAPAVSPQACVASCRAWPLPLPASRSAACHTGSTAFSTERRCPHREAGSGWPRSSTTSASRRACPGPSSPGCPSRSGSAGRDAARGRAGGGLCARRRARRARRPARRPAGSRGGARAGCARRGQRGRRRGDPVRAASRRSGPEVSAARLHGAARAPGGRAGRAPAGSRRGAGWGSTGRPGGRLRNGDAPTASPPRRSRGWRPRGEPSSRPSR